MANKIKVNDIVFWHDPAIKDFKPADRKKLEKQQYVVAQITSEEAWIYDIDDVLHQVQVLPSELEPVYPTMYTVAGYSDDTLHNVVEVPTIHVNKDAAVLDLVERFFKYIAHVDLTKRGKIIPDNIGESSFDELFEDDEETKELFHDGKLTVKKAKELLINKGVTELYLNAEDESSTPMWCEFTITEARPKD